MINLMVKNLEYRGHTVRGVVIDEEDDFLVVPDVEAAMPTTDLWNRAQAELEGEWKERCLKTVMVGSEVLQVIDHMALTLALHREKGWEQFRDWALSEALRLLIKHPECKEIVPVLKDEDRALSHFILHGDMWSPLTGICKVIELDASSPLFNELGKGEIGTFTVMTSQGEQTGVYVSILGQEHLYTLMYPDKIADFAREHGHAPQEEDVLGLMYQDMLRQTEENRQKIAELERRTARNVIAHHLLGNKCDIEYSYEDLREALTAHLDAVKKEALPIEQELGKFLFEEATEIMHSLPIEYLWFRFLREQVGVAMIDPDEIHLASKLQTKSVSDPKRAQYNGAFAKWLDDLSEAKQLHVVYYEGMRGILMVQPAVCIAPWEKHPGFAIRVLAIANGPELIELESFTGEDIIDVCERAHNYLPMLADYARSGYAPVVSLAVRLTPYGNEGVIYWPDDKRFYYWNPEIDAVDEEDAA